MDIALHPSISNSERRDVLRGLLTTALGVSVATSASVGAAAKAPLSALDFARPEHNLRALLKLMGDLSGARTYMLQHGRIYGVESGGRARHLMNYTGLTVREIRIPNPARYVSRYAGWMLMQDPLTSAVIDSWENPFTGERLEIEHFATTIGKQAFTENGLERPPGFQGEFTWFDRPFRLPWQVIGDDVWVPYEQFTQYRDRAGRPRYELAIHTYSGRLSQLTDGTTIAGASIASQSQSPFFAWMKQPDNSGHLILHSAGRKLSSRSELPASFTDELERRFPAALSVRFEW